MNNKESLLNPLSPLSTNNNIVQLIFERLNNLNDIVSFSQINKKCFEFSKRYFKIQYFSHINITTSERLSKLYRHCIPYSLYDTLSQAMSDNMIHIKTTNITQSYVFKVKIHQVYKHTYVLLEKLYIYKKGNHL